MIYKKGDKIRYIGCTPECKQNCPKRTEAELLKSLWAYRIGHTGKVIEDMEAGDDTVGIELENDTRCYALIDHIQPA